MEQQIHNFLHTKMPRVASDIEALFRNSIRIKTTAVEDESTIPVGASKIGGTPDLPPDNAWPEWKGIPLAFIAQLNMSDTAALDTDNLLPKTGLLSFFYEATDTPWGFKPEDRGSAVVFYVENTGDNLARAIPPEDIPEYSTFKPCALKWSTEATIPERGSHYIDVLELTSDPERWRTDRNGRYDVVKEVPISERPNPDNKEEEYYDELTWKIRESYNESVHRLLGYSDNIQGSMELECQLVTNGIYTGDQAGYQSEEGQRLAEDAGDWILLLQIDSDANGMEWGDIGRIYYWIRKQELAKRDFSNIWLVLQCY